MASAALSAGKHVVVDKPFTVTSGEADQLIALAKKRNLVLSVYHNRRFDSDFRTIQKVIAQNLLGPIVELEMRYDRFRNYLKPGAWREEDTPGSGILFDLGAHRFYQVLTLFGEPEAVTAHLIIQRKGGKVDDNFEVILHYPTVKASIKAGMLVREPLPHYILLGNEGTFIKYGMDVQEEALKAGFNPNTKPGWGIEPATGKINTDFNNTHFVGNIESEPGNYADFYQNICNTILGKEQLFVTPEQGRNVVRIIELAIQSHLQKKTVPYTFSGD